MPLSITGYILDPVRVGGSNSPFTLSPDNLISDQVAFDAAYPSDETEPRTEYLIQVLEETVTTTGPGGNRSLPDALFMWTKNEGDFQGGLQVPFQRFDYSGQDQRFKTLQGSPVENLGTLVSETPGPGSNTNRLVAAPAPLLDDLAAFPVRITVGDPLTPTLTPTIVIVADDATLDGGSPAAGTVEISRESGNLGWNATDLTTYAGQDVFYQRQSFFFPSETTGSIGIVGTDDLLLNPIPATGQLPLLKFGAEDYLTVIEVAVFGSPAAGTVEWQTGTGILNLSAADLVTFATQPLVYDGVALATFQVPSTPIGTINSPSTISVADEAEDLFFRIPGVVQFPETIFVDTLNPTGKRGQVQIQRSDGQVQFSATDITRYMGQTVEVVRPDVLIERGHTLRLFRTPVDPGATDDTIKDVTALYTLSGADAATLADPIIGSPSVFLPAIPRTDLALAVRVEQGSGSFTDPLSRLDVASPPTGKGFILDLDQRQLLYAERKEDEIQPTPTTQFGAIQLPNFPVFSSNLVVELEDTAGVGDWQTLVLDEDFTIDLPSGTIIYTQTDGTLVVEGVTASISGSTLTDTSQDFTVAGVLPGDLLLLPSGGSAGVYTVVTVGTTTLTVDIAFPTVESNVPYEIRRSQEILADRYFREVPPVDPNTKVEKLNSLGAATNVPRLNINSSLAGVSRFRFDKTGPFSTTVTVANDGVFTAPGSLASGTVEISLGTGNLNFSSADLGQTIYWSRELALGVEYTLQPGLGFIEFSERMLENEEIYLTYAVFDDDGNKVVIEERGVFLVSKELTQPHPTPTSTLFFNPDGREVASNPVASVYRGGRPQTSDQVSINEAISTITFVGGGTITDALPSGPVVSPSENVYIDYYIHEAIGGEKNISVIRPPMAAVTISIEEGATSFTIEGDRTADFPNQHLLKVDGSEIYLLAAPTFGGTTTTVNLDQSVPQAFKSDLTNPTLEITSGATRKTAVGLTPAYFSTEGTTFDVIPRGSKEFKLTGDLSRTYTSGTAIFFSDGATFQDFNLVEGSTFDSDLNRTVVTLSTNVQSQYGGAITLKRSDRPILPSPSSEVFTSRAPLLDLPYTVFRRVEGEAGTLLLQGVDYTIDEAGRLTFTDPLTLNEEITILYTGAQAIEAGRRTRASWTFTIVPSLTNGLLNQILKMEYSTYIPDTFFYRVETMTNYRGELAEQFSEDAKANSPSQGPILENSAGNSLFEQGNEGLYFQERDLANQDLVARPILKFYNDAINYLEDYLEANDGRVVGDRDGRFLFDGLIDNPIRTSFGAATNQIDDYIILLGSSVVQAYTAANFSRFFPTFRRTIGKTENPASLVTGDPVYDTTYKPLTVVNLVQRRFSFAMVLEEAAAGATVLQVDDANGNDLYERPDFVNGTEIEILSQSGALLDGTGRTVSSHTATSITLNGGVATTIPAGSTIRMAGADTNYRQTYLVGVDVQVNANDGLLLYVDPDDVPNPPFTPKADFTAIEKWDVTVGTFHDDTSPYRFPALDGGITDDDGDIQTSPILTPQADSEVAVNPLNGLASGVGYLNREEDLITDILAESDDPFQGVGNVVGTTLALTSPASFPNTPQPGDIVYFLTGANAGGNAFRVVSALPASITLETAPTADTGALFTCSVVPTALETGSGGGVSTSGTTFTDTGANFTGAGVQPGHTVVVTTGTNQYDRRQVHQVNSATSLTLVSAFPSATSNFTYRIDNSLMTFGESSNSSLEVWRTNLQAQEDILNDNADSEINSLENYIDTVASTESSGANGATTLPSTFTDGTADFVADNIGPTDYLWVRSGPDRGLYTIVTVATTTITVSETFTSATGSLSYEVLRPNVVSLAGLRTVDAVLQNSETAYNNIQTVTAALASITVTNDAGAFAHILRSSDLSTRNAQVSGRISEAITDAGEISAIMSSTDRLYDGRFVWIDSRVNLESGIRVRQVRAVESREEALLEIIQDLTKLLTV